MSASWIKNEEGAGVYIAMVPLVTEIRAGTSLSPLYSPSIPGGVVITKKGLKTNLITNVNAGMEISSSAEMNNPSSS